MAKWCLDANLAIATLLPNPDTPRAKTFWTDLPLEDEVVAPCVFFPECMSVIRWLVSTSVLSETEGREKTGELLDLPIRINTSVAQFGLAFDWALQAKRIKMHDLHYLVVAQIEQAEILTLDGGMRQAAIEHNVSVSLLR